MDRAESPPHRDLDGLQVNFLQLCRPFLNHAVVCGSYFLRRECWPKYRAAAPASVSNWAWNPACSLDQSNGLALTNGRREHDREAGRLDQPLLLLGVATEPSS